MKLLLFAPLSIQSKVLTPRRTGLRGTWLHSYSLGTVFNYIDLLNVILYREHQCISKLEISLISNLFFFFVILSLLGLPIE